MHVGVAALVTLMVNLAFWQAHRLEERQEFNATVTARSAVALAPATIIFRATSLLRSTSLAL